MLKYSKYTTFLLSLIAIAIYLSTQYYYTKTDTDKTFNILSISYISSYIFYLIVVYFPEKRKKNDLAFYVFDATYDVIRSTNQLLKTLIEQSKHSPDNIKKLKKSDFHQILLKIKPDSNTPMVIIAADNSQRNANWLTYLKKLKDDSLNPINKLFTIIPYC